MEQEDHRPTLRDRFHAKWAVIAALAGALVGASVQYVTNRDVTDAKLLEMSGEIGRERARADHLEIQLRELLTKTQQPTATTSISGPSEQVRAGEVTADTSTSPIRNRAIQQEQESGTITMAATSGAVVQDPFHFTLEGCSHLRKAQRVRCRLIIENISDSKQRLLLNPVYASGGRISFLATADGRQFQAGGTLNAVGTALRRTPEYVPGVPMGVDLVFPGVTETLGEVILVVEADKGLMGREFTLRFDQVRVEEE